MMRVVLFCLLMVSQLAGAFVEPPPNVLEDEQSYIERIQSTELQAVLYELVQLYEKQDLVEFHHKVRWLGIYLASRPDKAEAFMESIRAHLELELYEMTFPVIVGLIRPLAAHMSPFWARRFRTTVARLHELERSRPGPVSQQKAIEAGILVSALTRYQRPIKGFENLVESLLTSPSCQRQRTCLRMIYSAYRPFDEADLELPHNQAELNALLESRREMLKEKRRSSQQLSPGERLELGTSGARIH